MFSIGESVNEEEPMRPETVEMLVAGIYGAAILGLMGLIAPWYERTFP